nr:MAG TPA: hypothetical protein [Caudoviricetes sp.]
MSQGRSRTVRTGGDEPGAVTAGAGGAGGSWLGMGWR